MVELDIYIDDVRKMLYELKEGRPISSVPNIEESDFRQLQEHVLGTTSNKMLEQAFIDKLEEAGPYHDKACEILREAGGARGGFEDSGLLDAPAVEKAYGAVATSQVLPGVFNLAVATGIVLSHVPKRKSANAVAAALLDIAQPDRDPQMPVYKRLGPAIVRILQNNSTYHVHTPDDALRAPQGFRQVVVAREAAWLNTISSRTEQALAGDEASASKAFTEAAAVERRMYNVIAPIAKKAESPSLEEFFRDQLGKFSDILEPHRPEVRRLFTIANP